MSFENQKQETVNSEELLLTQNFLQLYHAQKAQQESGAVVDAVSASGSDFREWLSKPEVGKIMQAYIESVDHHFNDISHFVGMDKLEQLYDAYHSGTSSEELEQLYNNYLKTLH